MLNKSLNNFENIWNIQMMPKENSVNVTEKMIEILPLYLVKDLRNIKKYSMLFKTFELVNLSIHNKRLTIFYFGAFSIQLLQQLLHLWQNCKLSNHPNVDYTHTAQHSTAQHMTHNCLHLHSQLFYWLSVLYISYHRRMANERLCFSWHKQNYITNLCTRFRL